MNTTPEQHDGQGERPGHGQGADRRRSSLLAGALAVAGTLVIAFAFVQQQPGPPSLAHVHDSPAHLSSRPDPASPPATSPPPSQSPRPHRHAAKAHEQRMEGIRGPVMNDSPPTRITIGKLGVRSGLERLALDRSGAMTVPRDPARAGWFASGPTPGSPGPAVIAGHVTWDRKPAVFFDLANLRPGDRIEVERKDGSTATFTVTGLKQYDKDRFPTQRIYGPIDHAGLRLITCGGEYDDKRHRYKANLIAFAELTSTKQ